MLAGAPGHDPSLKRARAVAAGLSAGEWAALAFVLLTVVLVTQPLQVQLVRALEGYSTAWPLRPLLTWKRDRHAATLEGLRTVVREGDADAALAAADRARFEYPPDEARVLPTRLGNALRAFEDRAGEYYGWDTIVAWPRLYALLPDRAAAIVADARNQLDSACSFAVAFGLASVVTCGLLIPRGAWCLLALVPAAVAWLAYRGAVSSALALGLAVQTAFDLHRLELLVAMGLAVLPADADEERRVAAAVSALARSTASTRTPVRERCRRRRVSGRRVTRASVARSPPRRNPASSPPGAERGDARRVTPTAPERQNPRRCEGLGESRRADSNR